MKFWQMSDGIRLHHRPHHDDGYDGHGGPGAAWHGPSPNSVVDTGYNSAGNGGHGAFIGDELHAPVAIFNPLDAVRGGIHAKADANMAAGGTISALHSGSDPDNGSLDSIMIQSGANQAGNGGDGYFYGGIVHASFVVYQPINIAVAVGYGASADAEQTNNVSIDQSAVQIAGVGGNGGIGNTASGGSVGGYSSGAGVIATGGSSAAMAATVTSSGRC